MNSSRRRSLTGLIALNGALLLALGTVALAPKVMAQARARSSYTMVSGGIKGQTPPVVWIVDEGSQELVCMSWDDSKKQLIGMGYRNLATDINDIGRTRN